MEQVKLYFLFQNIFTIMGLGLLAIYFIGLIFYLIKDEIKNKKKKE